MNYGLFFLVLFFTSPAPLALAEARPNGPAMYVDRVCQALPENHWSNYPNVPPGRGVCLGICVTTLGQTRSRGMIIGGTLHIDEVTSIFIWNACNNGSSPLPELVRKEDGTVASIDSMLPTIAVAAQNRLSALYNSTPRTNRQIHDEFVTWLARGEVKANSIKVSNLQEKPVGWVQIHTVYSVPNDPDGLPVSHSILIGKSRNNAGDSILVANDPNDKVRGAWREVTLLPDGDYVGIRYSIQGAAGGIIKTWPHVMPFGPQKTIAQTFPGSWPGL